MGGIVIDNYGYESMAICFVVIYCPVIAANVKELWSMLKQKREGSYLPLIQDEEERDSQYPLQ